MLDELTKTFFDTFEIEPRLDCKRCGAKNFALGQCLEVNCEKTYPRITDRTLLELICILSQLQGHINDYYRIIHSNYEGLKTQILGDCICEKEHIKHQVRTLFKE